MDRDLDDSDRDDLDRELLEYDERLEDRRDRDEDDDLDRRELDLDLDLDLVLDLDLDPPDDDELEYFRFFLSVFLAFLTATIVSFFSGLSVFFPRFGGFDVDLDLRFSLEGLGLFLAGSWIDSTTVASPFSSFFFFFAFFFFVFLVLAASWADFSEFTTSFDSPFTGFRTSSCSWSLF